MCLRVQGKLFLYFSGYVGVNIHVVNEKHEI